MPAYVRSDPSVEVKREDVEKMVGALTELRDKALIVFLWLYGPRPSEVIEMLVEDIDVEPTKIVARIPTRKIRSKEHFEVEKRELIVRRPHPRDWLIETLVKYVDIVKKGDPKNRLWGLNHRQRVYDIVARASERGLGRRLSPYNFRHSRLTKLARAGWGIEGLKYWKGARTIKSIEPYLHARPVEMDLKDVER